MTTLEPIVPATYAVRTLKRSPRIDEDLTVHGRTAHVRMERKLGAVVVVAVVVQDDESTNAELCPRRSGGREREEGRGRVRPA